MGQRLTTVLKEKMWKVKNSAGDVEQMLPETSADQVSIADAAGKYTATDVEGALSEIATSISDLESGLASAGKVDDVRNNASDASTSIVTNKVADLSKAVVKEAGKVTNILSFAEKEESTSIYHRKCTYDGSVETVVGFQKGDLAIVEFNNDSPTKNIGIGLPSTGVTAGTYQGLTVDAKGRVTAAEDKGYAVKANVDTELAKKLDKAGGSVTGNLTIGGNLTVNGTTTSIDSTTLKVSDKLIEVAKDNTVKLTTPAGIVVPKYDGTNYGALVIDSDGNAQVGDVKLDASGNIDVTNSDLQTLATREGLTDGNLVKWDDTKKTLVPDTTVASNASSALSKANANATEIANIKNGTTKVKSAEHADTANSATNATNAANATDATNVTTNINGHAISDIFETNGTTIKKATSAGTADKVANSLTIGAATPDYPDTPTWSGFDGSSTLEVRFEPGDFLGEVGGHNNEIYRRYIKLSPTGVTAGEYTAIKVDEKGRATAGGKAFAFIEAGAAIPDDVMIGGIVFEAKA